MSAELLPLYTETEANWRGPELAAQPHRWQHTLSEPELVELEQTVFRLDADVGNIVDIERRHAPLPHAPRRLPTR